MGPENRTLSARSWTQKALYHLLPLTCYVQNDHIHADRQGCGGLEGPATTKLHTVKEGTERELNYIS